MTRILLFGAGKSASVLIRYLITLVQQEKGHLTVVDANPTVVQEKLQHADCTTAASFDITNTIERIKYIEQSDLVISLLPPALHILVAQDCLTTKKNLLTASYVDGDLKKLQPEIEAAGVLFLCEMGLDPGIDHMSAKAMIDTIQVKDGKITSFLSHCGGLVAPESDNNPWHYKISWNPRNVVLAGKAGAVYWWNNTVKKLEYRDLFAEQRFTNIPGLEPLCWYPNRNSLPYRALYGLETCDTFIRTTLRHPDFILGWKNIIDLQLTDESLVDTAKDKPIKQLFEEHLHNQGYIDLSTPKPEITAKTMGVTHKQTSSLPYGRSQFEKQLYFLGLHQDDTLWNREQYAPADLLQFALEKKLALGDNDKDMVVMQHEIEYELQGTVYKHTSTLKVKGEDNVQTAMAKTVGLPLAIAAKLILQRTISCKGLHIPISKEIYEPVLAELEQHGIQFLEQVEEQDKIKK